MRLSAWVSQLELSIRGRTPSSIGTEKKSRPVSLAMASPPATPGRYTKDGSTMPFSPLLALMSFSVNLVSNQCCDYVCVVIVNWFMYRKPAYAIESVAEPAPPLASTTSSPPNWTPVVY